MIISWAREAIDQLESQVRHINQQGDFAAAKRLYIATVRAVDNLSDHPMMGAPGRRAGTREVVEYPLVVIYKVLQDEVLILRVKHGRQLRRPR